MTDKKNETSAFRLPTTMRRAQQPAEPKSESHVVEPEPYKSRFLKQRYGVDNLSELQAKFRSENAPKPEPEPAEPAKPAEKTKP